MNATKLRCAGFSLLLGVAGCGDEELDRGVERHLTITQGIYGQLTSFDDTGGGMHYLPGVAVDAFAVPTPPPEPPLFAIPPDEDLGPPIATMESSADGFYELPLDPGDYLLCAEPCGPDRPRCTIATVPAGGLVRRDYASGNAPQGWSP
jgi:hypothetical protein